MLVLETSALSHFATHLSLQIQFLIMARRSFTILLCSSNWRMGLLNVYDSPMLAENHSRGHRHRVPRHMMRTLHAMMNEFPSRARFVRLMNRAVHHIDSTVSLRRHTVRSLVLCHRHAFFLKMIVEGEKSTNSGSSQYRCSSIVMRICSPTFSSTPF